MTLKESLFMVLVETLRLHTHLTSFCLFPHLPHDFLLLYPHSLEQTLIFCLFLFLRRWTSPKLDTSMESMHTNLKQSSSCSLYLRLITWQRGLWYIFKTLSIINLHFNFSPGCKILIPLHISYSARFFFFERIILPPI